MQESTQEKEIREAFARSGWSIAELRERSGLHLTTSNLRRKLVGDDRVGRPPYVSISPAQCERLIRALGGTLVITFPGSTVTIAGRQAAAGIARSAA